MLKKKDLFSRLTGDNYLIVFSSLEELDSATPEKTEIGMLKQAVDTVTDPVLKFQLRKSLRLAIFKSQKAKFKVSLDGLEKLLSDPKRLDDLALGIATVVDAEAFMGADIFRQAGWQNFPNEVLPSFCNFFAKYSGHQDIDVLEDLTRHSDAAVVTSALIAIFRLDPSRIENLIIPLLDSPLLNVKQQVSRLFYQWNPLQATRHIINLLSSEDEQTVIAALSYADLFPYPELESHLIRLICEFNNPPILMRISQVLRENAHIALPFRIAWVSRSLPEQHKTFIKGILLAIVQTLHSQKLIHEPVKQYLNDLDAKLKEEEEAILKKTWKIAVEDEKKDFLLPPLEEISDDFSDNLVYTPPKKRKEVSFDSYASMEQIEKIKFWGHFTKEDFDKHYEKILEFTENLEGKELASVINLFSKFATEENDFDSIKKLIESEDPDIVSASIRAMARLDPEYLCVYLPKFMQDKNGKIRMTATRALMSIDSERVKGLLCSLIASPNIRQRTLGVSVSMLVDFNLVRDALILALKKENTFALIEKITMVLASNPDREIIYQIFAHLNTVHDDFQDEKTASLNSIVEKLVIKLNHSHTFEELMDETQVAYEQQKAMQIASLEKEKELEIQKQAQEKENQELKPVESVKKLLTSEDDTSKTKRAKINLVVWVMVAIVWAILFVYIIFQYLL